MADYDSVDLLRRFKNEVGLETASEFDDTTDLYPLLADAQEQLIREIAIRYPNALYQAPTALTAVSGNKTFTFGTVGGADIMPMGWVQISPRLSAFSGDTSYLWREGVDFLDEGTRIRIPSDRSYSGTLYGRWIPRPARITSSQAPSIRPVDAGELIVILAGIDWAGQGDQKPRASKRLQQKWNEKFPVWMATWRRRFRGGGALDPALWYMYAPDLGSS